MPQKKEWSEQAYRPIYVGTQEAFLCESAGYTQNVDSALAIQELKARYGNFVQVQCSP